MKNYNQIKEAIRDICTSCGVNEIKSANKQVKKFLGAQLIQIEKVEDELSTVVWYSFMDDEED